jgi:hypothetical protein
MNAFCQGDAWLWATSAAALGTLLYGWLTGAWPLAVTGQVFTFTASVSFAGALIHGHPAWHAALVPVLNLALTSLLFSLPPSTHTDLFASRGFPRLAQGYRLAAMTLLSGWAWEYVAAEGRVAFFAGLGAVQILLGALSSRRERTITGAVYAAIGLALYWMGFNGSEGWRDLVAILAVPASLRLGRRISGDEPLSPSLQNGLIGVALASVWLWVTRWMNLNGHADQITTGWAVLALITFAIGLALRERLYRLGGFAFLSLAAARLFITDVWRFDTLARIISFLALGAVLLALSFVYNRFAETMRRWL